jgi:hypothetical protein
MGDAAFLLSDAGVNVSGQSLGVDGDVETLSVARAVRIPGRF